MEIHSLSSPSFPTGKPNEPLVDFREEQALRAALRQQLETLQNRWPGTIDATQVQMIRESRDQLILRNQEVEITFSNMERLEKELCKILDEQQVVQQKLSSKLDQAAHISTWQSTLSVFSVAINCGSAIATGGTFALTAAGVALIQAAHQFACDKGIYSQISEQLAKDEKSGQQTAVALQKGVGFFCMSLSLAQLFLGGGSALEKGFKEASQLAADGTSLFSSVAQNFVSVKQARVNKEKTEIDIQVRDVEFTLALRHLDQENFQENYEISLTAMEKRFAQAVQMLKISADLHNKIGGGE